MMKSTMKILSLLMALSMLFCVTDGLALNAQAATMPSIASLRVTQVYTTSAKIKFTVNNPSKLKITKAYVKIRKKGGSWNSAKTISISSADQKKASIECSTKVGYGRSYSVTLTQNTTYEYQAYVVYNGKTYSSSKTFTTANYDTLVNAFISDSRWKNGTTWGARKPKLSSYASTGCCAYCADFVKYVYNLDHFLDDTKCYTSYTNVNNIKNGDVLYVKHGSSGHYFVVLSRNGNNLYTAEGNVTVKGAKKVKVSKYKTYTIKNGKIHDSYNNWDWKLSNGYHFV